MQLIHIKHIGQPSLAFCWQNVKDASTHKRRSLLSTTTISVVVAELSRDSQHIRRLSLNQSIQYSLFQDVGS